MPIKTNDKLLIRTRKKTVAGKRTQKKKRVPRTRNIRGGAHNTNQCHPSIAASGDRIFDASCFTPDTLDEIKTAFNSQKDTNKKQRGGLPQPRIIHSSDPVKVWNHIRESIPECDRETCWVEKIADPVLKEKLQKQLFVPKRPEEWAEDKNSWLSNYDISRVMDQYQTAHSTHGSAFRFIGPGFIDYDYRNKDGQCVIAELCNMDIGGLRTEGVRYVGIVFNLDKHTGKGTHWVSVFIDISRETPFFFYFNSTGEPIPDEIVRFRKEVEGKLGTHPGKTNNADQGKVKFYSSSTEHQHSDTECGMYSLVFLVTMLTGERPTSKLQNRKADTMTMDQRIEYFTDPSTKLTDAVVEEFRHVYFR